MGYILDYDTAYLTATFRLGRSTDSTRVNTTMNNDLYNKTITEDQGRVYHYDPDQDIYYRRYEPMSKWDRFGWLAVTLVLVLAVIYFEYNPIR